MEMQSQGWRLEVSASPISGLKVQKSRSVHLMRLWPKCVSSWASSIYVYKYFFYNIFCSFILWNWKSSNYRFLIHYFFICRKDMSKRIFLYYWTTPICLPILIFTKLSKFSRSRMRLLHFLTAGGGCGRSTKEQSSALASVNIVHLIHSRHPHLMTSTSFDDTTAISHHPLGCHQCWLYIMRQQLFHCLSNLQQARGFLFTPGTSCYCQC